MYMKNSAAAQGPLLKDSRSRRVRRTDEGKPSGERARAVRAVREGEVAAHPDGAGGQAGHAQVEHLQSDPHAAGPGLPLRNAQARRLLSDAPPARSRPQIGRPSCRERVCQFVLLLVVAVPFKKKKKNQ